MRRRWLAAMVLGFLLVTPAGAAKKPHLSARIHGHPLKSGGKRLQVESFSTVFEIVASTKNVRFNRAMGIACVAFDLASMPLPATLSQCNGTYQETRIGRRGASAKVWSGTGMQITVESFDGSTARGTFGGAFEVSGQGDGPAVIQNGKFNAVVTTVGPPG